MADGGWRILILAGRLSRYDARSPLAPWLDRLERRGCRLQVALPLAGNVLADDPRCFEMPGAGQSLDEGMGGAVALVDDGLERPDLVHVIHDEMSEAALIVSEIGAGSRTSRRWPTSGPLGRGLRLSRRWCRQLVAIRPGSGGAVWSTDWACRRHESP